MPAMPGKPATTPIPVQLSASEFTQFTLPHLTMPKRGPRCKLGYHRVFNLILWVLYTGMQWKCLPVPKDTHGNAAIHYTTVYKVFARWSDDGSLEDAFIASVGHLSDHNQLDLSVLHGDGTNTVAKKGGDGIGYSGYKHQKGEKVIAIIDNNGYVLAPLPVAPVNEQMILDLAEAAKAIAADTDVRVLVIKGEGRAFCSGMDLRAAANRPADRETLRAVWEPWRRALDILENLNPLTLVSIHGPCLGAGFELMLACDFRVAATTAFFSSPQVLYGAPPDAGPTYRLPQLIGLAKAKEIVILGERFDAAQAERWGLLTKIVEPENLAAETTKLVERCLKVGWKAAAATKHLLPQAGMLDSEALAVEIDRARAASIETGEFTESMQIYREKRKPQV